ncbi:MAG: isocitrate lyase/phosphoenolpyruvate mutase family protein [Hyphomicrobiaceae bacterium]|jgi:2-methylisocitrate lyase-like PEP mutase family enzyme
MPRQAEKGTLFRSLHERPGSFVIPNPWDVGSARLLAHVGFEALATTSAGFAFSLGLPDGNVTRDWKLAHCREIVQATELPVSADLEKCFADEPAGVAETVRLAAQSGLVGCSVEDATGDPAKPIFEFDFAVERVRAAVEAARALPFPFTLTARAENLLHGRKDMADTIKRLQAFEAVGANVLYAPGLATLDEVREVISAVNKPVNVLVVASSKGFSVESLAAAGVKRISVGGTLARVAYGAVLGAAQEMKDKGSFSFTFGGVSNKELGAIFSNWV